MRFWNYKSDEFYNLYSQIFDSNFSIEKKKVVLKALFSGEYSLMRITSISKQCYEEYKKNNFKKVTKFKRANKKFVRHQFVTFNETLKVILERKFEIKDFWKIIDENEQTHLITRGEKDKEEYSYINIPIEGAKWPPFFVENEFITKKLSDIMVTTRDRPYGAGELTLVMQKQSN